MLAWDEIKTVYLKEMTEIIRNRRVVISTFVLPIIIFPIIFGSMSWLQGLDQKIVQEEGFVIAVRGDQQEIKDLIDKHSDKPVSYVFTKNLAREVYVKNAQAGLEVGDDALDRHVFWLYYLSSDDKSQKAAGMITDIFSKTQFSLVRKSLAEELSDSSIIDYDIGESQFLDIASIYEKSGHKIAKILPIILILTLVSGCSFAAVDLIAGEKERGSFETLLVSPIHRRSVITGKMMIVVTTGLISLLINLSSLLLTLKLGFFDLNQETKFEFTISIGSVIGVFLCALPITLLLASALILISARAKTYQSGQTLIMPFTLLAMVPGIAATLPGMKSNSFLLALPIANIVVAMKEMLEGTLKIWPMLIANGVNLVFATALVSFTIKSMEREGSLISESVSDTEFSLRMIQKNPVRTALIGFVLVWLSMFYFMAPFQIRSFVPGMIVTQWVLFFGAALLMVLFQKLPLKQTLSLNKTTWKVWAGTILFQVGALPVILSLNQLMMKLLPIPMNWLENFNEVMAPDLPSYSMVLLMAASPGICEELLFRGAIQGSFQKKWSPLRSIIITGLLFGIMHFSIYRLFATTLLGISFGWIVHVSGSLYPAMLAHALNNTIALVVIPRYFDLSEVTEQRLLLGIPFVIMGGLLILYGSGRKRS
ncbi:MAG: ABC transporter permease subunit/CPBP intramembrane protease [bacterium]